MEKKASDQREPRSQRAFIQNSKLARQSHSFDTVEIEVLPMQFKI